MTDATVWWKAACYNSKSAKVAVPVLSVCLPLQRLQKELVHTEFYIRPAKINGLTQETSVHSSQCETFSERLVIHYPSKTLDIARQGGEGQEKNGKEMTVMKRLQSITQLQHRPHIGRIITVFFLLKYSEIGLCSYKILQ
jgi:hypothetical protein